MMDQPSKSRSLVIGVQYREPELAGSCRRPSMILRPAGASHIHRDAFAGTPHDRQQTSVAGKSRVVPRPRRRRTQRRPGVPLAYAGTAGAMRQQWIVHRQERRHSLKQIINRVGFRKQHGCAHRVSHLLHRGRYLVRSQHDRAPAISRLPPDAGARVVSTKMQPGIQHDQSCDGLAGSTPQPPALTRQAIPRTRTS